MLGNLGAGGGGEDARSRRDVDGSRVVAAGSHDVEHVVSREHGHGAGLHGPGHARHLSRGLTLGAEKHQKSCDLRGISVEKSL